MVSQSSKQQSREEEIRTRLSTIYDLPYSPRRTTLVESLLRDILRYGPEDQLPMPLFLATEEYIFVAPSRNVFSTYSKALGLLRAHPEFYDAESIQYILLGYPWVARLLSEYTEIPLSISDSFFSEMRSDFKAHGYDDSTVDFCLAYWYSHIGEEEKAKQYRELCYSHFRSHIFTTPCIDAPADRAMSVVSFLLEEGEYEEALKISVSESTLSPNVAKMWREQTRAALSLGKAELASSLFSSAQLHAQRNTFEEDKYGDDFEILIRAGHIEKAFSFLSKNEAKAFSSPYTCGVQFTWLRNLIAGLSSAMDQPDHPTGLSIAPTISSLRDWALGEINPLVEKFNRRNSNNYYSRLLDEALHTNPYPVSFPQNYI